MKVGEESNGVTVELADGASLHADHGICTLPPHLASTIPSPWPRAVQRLLQASTPFTTGKLALDYDRRFWELDDRIFGGASRTDRPPRTIWYPSHGYLEPGGIVVGAYPFGPAADEFSAAEHAARQQVAVAAGRALHGTAYKRPRSSFSVDWLTEPHSEGAWASWEPDAAALRTLAEPGDRGSFAGDWASRSIGWQHGAFESAGRAVSRLHERVMAR